MTNPWAWREVTTMLQVYGRANSRDTPYRGYVRRRWHGWEWKVVGKDFRAIGFESSRSDAEWEARFNLRDLVIAHWIGARVEDLEVTT